MSTKDASLPVAAPTNATLQPSIYVAYLIPNNNTESAIPITTVSSLLERQQSRLAESPVDMGNEDSDHEPSYLIVGRQSTIADVHIQHNSISRKHALLYYTNDDATTAATSDGGKFMIYDLGSKYGTTINQHRISSSQLALDDGDTIQFGNDTSTIYTVKLMSVVPETGIDSLTSDGEKSNIWGDFSNNAIDSSRLHHQQQQQQQEQQSIIEKAGEGLTGRAKHQAEIAAMMESFDVAPTYTTVGNQNNNYDYKDDNDDEKQNMMHSLNRDYCDYGATTSANDQTMKRYQIPVSQHVVYNESDEMNNYDRSNIVKRKHATPTCICIDPNGARFCVGSTDMTIQMYDFGNIVSRSFFKSIIPDDGYWPISCCYSNTGDKMIVGTGSVQPTILNREGESIIKFIRGDMYITDQSKTNGHTASVTGVDWHPYDRNIVITSSKDGSVRLWNLSTGKQQFKMLLCEKVFQPKNRQGKRTTVLCVSYHPSGREFAIGTSCGSVQIWNATKVTSTRPERVIYNAHGTDKHISSLCYNYDGTRLATRCYDDDVIKVWNASKLSSSSQPLVNCNDAPTVYEQANIQFSPDGKLLCAGISKISVESNDNKRNETGRLHFYDVLDESSSKGKLLLSLNIRSNIGAVLIAWHSKINQIFVACSDGQIIVYFDPVMSQKGAINSSGKVRKSVDGLTELLRSRVPYGSSIVTTGEIVTPLYNPNLGQNKRKRNEMIDNNDGQTMEPERPATGKYGSDNLKFQQYVADQRLSVESSSTSGSKIIAGKDPRQALFRYNEGKAFVDRAYGDNQKILAEKTAEQEEEDEVKKRKQTSHTFF